MSNLTLKNYFPIPRIIVIAMWVIYLLLVWLFIGYITAVMDNENNLYGRLPSFDELENPTSSVASEIFYAGGESMGKYFRDNRTPIEYKNMSKNMLNALIATEDVRFKKHNGVDLKGLSSIPFALLRGQRRGASTITQQLAKNLYDTRSAEFDGKWTELDENPSTLDKIIRMVIIKTKEWITAVRLESSYTKNEIISMYLNTVDFGSHAFGVKVASQTFFNKPQDQLKIEEAAVLVGLLKAPTYYSPVRNPNNSLRRRNTVLGQLEKYNFITEEAFDSIKAMPLVLDHSVEDHNTGNALYFKSVLSNHLIYWCKKRGIDLWADGLKIYTTIDSTMQSYAEQAVNEHMAEQQKLFFKVWKGQNPWSIEKPNGGFEEDKDFLETNMKRTEAYRYAKRRYAEHPDSIKIFLNTKRPMQLFAWNYKTSQPSEVDTVLSSYDSLAYVKHFLHTGFMSMNPKTGEIKAWVGGINFKYFQYDHVKQGIRQPGSTFKPIVYATILGEAGDVYSPCYKAVDAPVTFLTGDPEKPTWTPQNAEGVFTGDTMTIRQAMARSKNSITAYMMKILGENTPFMVKRYAENLGISSHLEAVPAMCLGTFDVSVFDMVGAYSTFANKGTYTKPFFISRIEDKYGNTLMEFKKEKRSVMTEEAAYTMLYMLRGATEEEGGTARGLWGRYPTVFNNDNQVGAKTGTTQNFSDGWFMGVTKELVSGAWVGCEDRSVHFKTIVDGQGARMAMPIWGKYMEKVYSDKNLKIEKGPFEKPPKFSDYDCKSRSGKQATINAAGDTLKTHAPVYWDNDEDDGF